MAAWSLRPNVLDEELNAEKTFEASRVNSESALPARDYFLQHDSGMGTDEDTFDLRNDGPVGRAIVESSNKFYVERNLFSHLSSTYQPRRTNHFQDEDIELEAMCFKPPTFVFLGKPGVGKTTQAKKLAEKLNAVLISPQSIVDHYKQHDIPSKIHLDNNDGTINHKGLMALVTSRCMELDVFHKGYVMDGFPIFRSDEITVEDQLNFINGLPMKPNHLIILHMQDVDLFKRRRDQKFDPMTSTVYTKDQYFHKKLFDPITYAPIFQPIPTHHGARDDVSDSVTMTASQVPSESALGSSQDLSGIGPFAEASGEDSLDFEPLSPDIIRRLISRLDDRPKYINRDFLKFREARPFIQTFIDSCDRRRVLELSSYWQPSIIFKSIMEFIESIGISPTPAPIRLISPTENPGMFQVIPEDQYYDSDELGEEQPCIPYEEVFGGEVDWDAALRAVTVRGRVDPRFRWRITRWKNLCPVSLKTGNTVIGKPELAVGFMDKVYFLHSEDALRQFEFNPRPYLLPTMPASPVKFFVTGQPLAGKTLFAEELARLCGGYVIDMKREFRKTYDLVKNDYLFRVRLEALMEITTSVDRDNFESWKRSERHRREEVMKWIERFIRMKANAEINGMLDLAKDELRKRRAELRAASEFHSLGPIYSGSCTADDGNVGFTWNDFVKAMREGRRNFTHQQRLELAWELFRAGKLRYKHGKRALGRLLRGGGDSSDAEGEFEGEGLSSAEEGSAEESIDGESPEAESEGEGSEDDSTVREVRKRRRHKRKICPPLATVDESDADGRKYVVKVESVVSSVFGPEEESDESIKLRFPEIPSELIEAMPRPSNVTEKDPMVEDVLAKRMTEAETWADSVPPQLYLEVLKRAIVEVEEKYLEQNPHGHLSGGWIVENLALDIEKWRALMRNRETKPDNVVVLLDTSPDHKDLMKNLKLEHNKSKPRKRFVEVQGEGGEAEFLGEDTDLDSVFQIQLTKSLHMSMSEFLVEILPIDKFGPLTGLDDLDPAMLSRLRNVSLTDSRLDPDQKRILGEWLETFGSALDFEEGALERKSGTPSSGRHSAVSGDQEPALEADWTPRRVQYEMLSTFSAEKGPDEGMGTAVTRLSPVTPPRKDSAFRRIMEEEFGEDIPRSLLHLLGDEEVEPPTPPSLLSMADILCPELGPEEAAGDLPCSPKIHDPSLKRIFERQIQAFDDWYNMLHSLLIKENVRSWQLGIADLDSAMDMAAGLWDELEARFEYRARVAGPNELNEEMDEWKDANKIWGMTHRTRGGLDDEDVSDEYGDEEDDEPVADDDEDGVEEEEAETIPPEFQKLTDPHAKLMGRPEEYLRATLEEERLRYYGDLKDYCPVTLFHLNVLRRGKYTAKWLDRTYYMADLDCLRQFLEEPARFLPTKKPLRVPPARICVTGSPGCGQEEVALKIATEHNVYFVNFRQRLHEIIKVQVGKDVGPGQASTVRYGDSGSLLGLIASDDSFGRSYEEEEEDGEEGLTSERLRQRFELQSLILQNLGIERQAHLAACPLTDISRTEKLGERDWRAQSKAEEAIQAFLTRGTQLPNSVLDEYVGQLWTAEPFRSKGFILVGFPNTAEDVQYLISRNCFPEAVHVVDSRQQTMRNRLVLPTIEDWKRLHPARRGKRRKSSKGMARPQARILTEKEKELIMNEYMPLPDSDDEEKRKMWKIEKDELTQEVTRALHRLHNLYSKGLKGLMTSLNRNRIRWSVIHSDKSLSESKRELHDRLNSALKYRTSLFEATFELNFKEAAALLEKEYFRLSKFGRMCPVEVYRGNTAINLWNAPGVQKIPILHRNYIYFLAGRENANLFVQNVWDIVSRNPPTPAMPLYVIVLGPPKSGKTELAARLADKLGLAYISQDSVINDTVRHSFLNQDTDFDMTSDHLMSGPMSMLMADEILAYLRGGHLIPQYMGFRALDLALMNPRAQSHGAVFDNYPGEEDQLQELLERGVVPSLVVNLKMVPEEGYRRAELRRFNPVYNFDEFTEDCNPFLDYLVEDYYPSINPCLEWYQNEIQCLMDVDATQSPHFIFEQVKARCIETMTKMQRYIYAVLKSLPAPLPGTSPLTSMLPSKLSRAFGSYDPVALNETNELVRVTNLTDLSRIIEYRGELFAFSTLKHLELFVASPHKYTPPTCLRLPPSEVPLRCSLTEEEMELLEEHWGFLDFDPVFYVEGNMQFKWLQRGLRKHCVEYKEQLYFFMNLNNMEKFLRCPDKYANIPVPSKVPPRAQPQPLEALTPAGYLIATGLTEQISEMLAAVGSKRPRFPFMSPTKSGILYMGYYLKSMDNKASPELRTHYRRAMAHITRTQAAADNLCRQLSKYHGKKSLPREVRIRLRTFLSLADKADRDKVVDPRIPGLQLSTEGVPEPAELIFKDILAELLSASGGSACAGNWDQLEEEEEEDEEVEGQVKFDMEEYVPPAYLAKGRLI